MDSGKGLSDRFSDPPDGECYPLDPDNLFKIKSKKFIFVQFDGDSPKSEKRHTNLLIFIHRNIHRNILLIILSSICTL